MMRDGPLVIFKSTPDFFAVERCGNKPNTVRLLTPREHSSDRLDFARACMAAGEPATIEMVNADNPAQVFFRRITSIEQIGTVLGQTMWVISWRHEDGVGTYDDTDEEA